VYLFFRNLQTTSHCGFKNVKSVISISVATTLLLLITHCNFTTQSYNMGKLLNPGESMSTLAMGGQPWYTVRDSLHLVYDSNNVTRYVESRKKIRESANQELSYCFDYRLGILDKYPFGKGLEFGFHIEAPVPSEGGGSLLLECDLRSGLPPAVLNNAVFHHNIGLGWTVGMWVDNGWYAEYAAGLEYKYLLPYTNIRLLYTPTDITGDMDIFGDNNFFKKHSQYWNIRQSLGCAVKIPRLPVLPDYIVPEVVFAYPNYNRFQHVGVTYHIGLRWLNGF
jgi:hypothetical protein